MAPLLCALLLSWLLLGGLRAIGTIAVNRHLEYGLYNLAGLDAWEAFFHPDFLVRSSMMLAVAAIAGAVAPVLGRSSPRRDSLGAGAALVCFWGLAGMNELVVRTPVRDVMSGGFVFSEAHIGILATALVGFASSYGMWRALRHAGRAKVAAVAGGAVAAAAVLLAPARFGVPDASAHLARPNILLITIDTLRADHLSIYGYARKTSPHMDRFAASGIVFENATSQASSTHPSMAAMLTSNYPTEFTGRPFKYVPYSMPTIAEALRDAGYKTGAVVSNVWLKSEVGFDQGFEDYDQESAMSEFYSDAGRVNWKTAAHVSDGGLAFLARHKDERFFLWLHYLDPHHPYEPQPPFDEEFAQPRQDHRELIEKLQAMGTNEQTKLLSKLGRREDPLPDETFQAVIDQYDGEIAYNDAQVGRVLDALDRLGISDDTVVVITADHGEEFREHGRWGHGVTLHREVIHVPLLARFPGEPGGRRVTRPVRVIDIGPSVLTAAGLPVPASMRGSDLRSAAGEPRDTRAISVCPRTEQLSIEADGWKLITPPRREGPPSLYNVLNDPGERQDLAASEPDRVVELETLLLAELGASASEIVSPRITGVDPATREQLEALGYLD